VFNLIARYTDSAEDAWTRRPARLARSGVLVSVLLGGIAVIELHRSVESITWLGDLPTVHLSAISWTVTVLLVFEVVEMIFSLGESVANSVARHLQVYALVLLRDAFSELAAFPEPIRVTSQYQHEVWVMATDAAGAILLFISAAFFTRMQRHTPITLDELGGARFVAVKKTVALGLIAVLSLLIVRDLYSLLWGENDHELFDTFFTILVFVDVLLAVVSLGITDNPAIIFRNFGFAFAAILLRLAIASPEFVRPILGLAGGLTAVAVTVAYNLASVPDAQRHTARAAGLTGGEIEEPEPWDGAD